MPPTSTSSPYHNKPDFDNRINYQTNLSAGQKMLTQKLI